MGFLSLSEGLADVDHHFDGPAGGDAFAVDLGQSLVLVRYAKKIGFGQGKWAIYHNICNQCATSLQAITNVTMVAVCIIFRTIQNKWNLS